MSVEFSESNGVEPHALLKLSDGKIGKGWKLIPLAAPTKASDCN